MKPVAGDSNSAEAAMIEPMEEPLNSKGAIMRRPVAGHPNPEEATMTKPVVESPITRRQS